MKRSILKGPYIAYYLLNKIKFLNNKNTKGLIKTWSRSSTIIPLMIGHTICIYNGKKHIPLYINDQFIGHKLGEFSLTRLFSFHKNLEYKVKN